MRRLLLMGALLMINICSFAQEEIQLTNCLKLAKENYPAIQSKGLIAKSKELSLSQLNTVYLPRIYLKADYHYQSDVTNLPINLPGQTIDPLSQHQYKVYGEFRQSITHFLTLPTDKELVRQAAKVENEATEVALYKVKERVNDLFFSNMLIHSQIELTTLYKKKLLLTRKTVTSLIDNGVRYKSDLYKVDIQIAKLDQKLIELNVLRSTYLALLSHFIDQAIPADATFVADGLAWSTEISNRPELAFYESRKALLEIKKQQVVNKTIPNLNLYLQTGYGLPALNFLANEAETYFLAGVALSWDISNFYTRKKELNLLDIERDQVALKRETFEWNQSNELIKHKQALGKMKQTIEKDEEIIKMTEVIVEDSKSQLMNGTTTTNDHLIELNALEKAKQNRATHQIEMLIAKSKLLLTTGNL